LSRSFLSLSSEFLHLAPIYDSDVFKAFKHLRPSKSVSLDNTLSFVIRCCSDTFIPVLKHIFNPSLPWQYLPTLWKQAAVVPAFKKDSSASFSNQRPISILNNFLNYLNLLFMAKFHITLSLK
jgi:hypothetical protein